MTGVQGQGERAACDGHYGPGQLREWDECTICNPAPPVAGEPSGEDGLAEVDVLAKVLADNGLWHPSDRTHLARTVLAAGYVSPDLLAAAVEQAKREALSEAADDIDGGDLPLLIDDEHKVRDWLRDRAASVARTGDTP